MRRKRDQNHDNKVQSATKKTKMSDGGNDIDESMRTGGNAASIPTSTTQDVISQREMWAFINTLQKFEKGMNYETFEDDLLMRVGLVTADTDKIRTIFMMALSPEVATELKQFLNVESLKSVTLTMLKSEMRKRYTPKKNVWNERKKFYEQSMREDETVEEFFRRLMGIGQHCKFEQMEATVRDKLVTGTTPNIYSKSLNFDPKTPLSEIMDDLVKIEDRERAKESATATAEVHAFKRSFSGEGAKPKQNVFERLGPKNTGNRCWRCHYTGHQPDECKFKEQDCDYCHKMGHTSRACNSKKRDEREAINKKTVKNVKVAEVSHDPILLNVQVNGQNLRMELDTGSGFTIMTKATYKLHFPEVKLKKWENLVLRTFTSEKCTVAGWFYAEVKFALRAEKLKILVVERGIGDLLGRDFLKSFDMTVMQINEIKADPNSDNVEMMTKQLIDAFPKLFEDKVGECREVTVSLETTEDLKPVYRKPRQIPYAYEEEVLEMLDDWEQSGIATPVDTCEFGTPLVVRPKNDGSLRICGDYKSTINQFLKPHNHVMPTTDEILRTLSGCTYFFVIDIRSAYMQLRLDDRSAEICTLSTPKGLYRMNRMPFGIRPASSIFQCEMDKRLRKVPRVGVFVDDIVGGGRTAEECKETTIAVFEILQKSGFTLKRKKLKLFKRKLEVLGHVIDSNGVAKNEGKVKAIRDVKPPVNVKEVQSFCGMVNYYAKFMPALSETLEPIHKLCRKEEKFDWNEKCQSAFEKIKKEMCNDLILAHYNPENPLILVTDASEHSIAAVLLTVVKDIERPIAFWARSLDDTQRNYSVVDKEALAVVKSCKKFSKLLLGRKFVLKTDQRSLLRIFGEKCEIPATASSRLQRWAIYLSGYDYEIKHVRSKENIADYMSRLKHPTVATSKTNISVIKSIRQEGFPIDFKELGKATEKDKELSFVIEMVSSENYEALNCKAFKAFYHRREELGVEEGVLMWNHRVVIPMKLRKQILSEIHNGHIGIFKMKKKARRVVWWPNLDESIEIVSKECEACLRHNNSPEKSPLIPWGEPEAVWERIHMDFAGPFHMHQFLVIVDAKSKWMEVFRGSTTSSEFTISCLRECFARFGLPKEIVSDNATGFTSIEFKDFLRSNGIRPRRGAPGHPSTNGQAENGVKTFKRAMKKMLGDGPKTKRQIEIAQQTFLAEYRNNVHCTTGKSPAEAFLGRSLRDRLSWLLPTEAKRKLVEIRKENKLEIERQIRNYGGRREKKFERGDGVMVRDFSNPTRKSWCKAKVMEKIGSRHYKCLLSTGRSRKCNIEQMLEDKSPRKPTEANWDSDDIMNEPIRNPDANREITKRTQDQPSEERVSADQPSEELVSTSEEEMQSQTSEVESSPTDSASQNESTPMQEEQDVPVAIRRSRRTIKAPDRLNL